MILRRKLVILLILCLFVTTVVLGCGKKNNKYDYSYEVIPKGEYSQDTLNRYVDIMEDNQKHIISILTVTQELIISPPYDAKWRELFDMNMNNTKLLATNFTLMKVVPEEAAVYHAHFIKAFEQFLVSMDYLQQGVKNDMDEEFFNKSANAIELMGEYFVIAIEEKQKISSR